MKVACLLQVLSCLALGACVFGDPPSGGEIGVRRSPSSGIEARVVACDPALVVRALRLVTATGGTQVRVLWRVEAGTAGEGGEQGVYSVGVAPPGYLETQPLTAEVDTRGTYAVLAELGDQSVTLNRAFRPEDLRETDWLVSQDRFVTADEFESLNVCNR